MTITLFLIICLGGILLLSIAFGGAAPRQGPDANIRQRVYAGIWLLIGISAVMLINRYLYPANKTAVFGNTDYHVLAHQGYAFTDSVRVADAQAPANALWDQLPGQATLVGGAPHRLELDSFYAPFFLQNEGAYRLANPIYTADVGGGFSLWQADSLLLRVKITPYPSGDSVAYDLAFGAQDSFVTSDFKARLSKGYPLADLLRRVEGWQAHDSLVQLCEGAWLLRQLQRDAASPLHFFPSPELAGVPGFSLHLPDSKSPEARQPSRQTLDIPEGARFFTGLGMRKSPVMKVKTEGRKQRLEFDFPRKYRFDHQETNQLFLCSDLRDVSQNTTQGGFLYPVFAEEENRFHVNATLRYAHGTARETLELAVVDDQALGKARSFVVTGGEEFQLQARDGRSGVQWIMRLTDLRADNPIGRTHLFAFLTAFLMLVLLTATWVGWFRLSTVEMALYILVFAFLQVRLLLQWRMGTFLPVDDATKGVYDILQSSRHFYLTVACAGLLFGLRWLLVKDVSHLGKGMQGFHSKVHGLGQSLNFLPKLQQSGPVQKWLAALREGKFLHFLLAFLAVWLPLLILAVLVDKTGVMDRLVRFLNIAAPVSFFFFIESLLEKYRPAQENRHRGIHPYALVNALLAIVFLALTDAGFGIIFMLFALIYQLYRTMLRPRKAARSAYSSEVIVPALLLVAAFVGLLFGADRLIAGIFSATTLLYWLLFVPVGLLLTWYFADFYLSQGKFAEKQQRIYLAGAMGVVLLLSVLFSGVFHDKIDHFSYVKYRAAVHEKGPDQIIQDEQFDSGQMGQILRAAQNQWYINTYLRSPEPEDGRENGYFNLRPHFDKGSSYTTQTTDLVVTRYIISEHGVGVVFLLILLFFTLAAVYSLLVDMSGKNRFVPFGMLLLLFMTALFIWLTATNRFIFFGQDFPLISLTSLFTLVFSLGLILTVMVTVPTEKSKRRESKSMAAVPIVVLLLIGLGLQFFKSGDGQENINFNPSLDQARADFNELNTEFLAFQNKLNRGYAPDSLILLFHQSRPDSTVSLHRYTQSIYNQFVREEEDKTNPEHLLYLVQRPVNRKLRYHFAVNSAYYLVRPPRESSKAWTGNLLAASENQRGAFLVGQGAGAGRIQIGGDAAQVGLENQLSPGNQLRTSVIPGSWMQRPKPVMVAWASQIGEGAPGFSLGSNAFGSAPQTRRQVDPAVRLREGDLLSLSSKNGAPRRFRYVEDYKAYLAKNIWLNGDRRMFYPLGEKLLWAYYYAEGAKNARSGTEARHDDVQVSVDFSLMQDLHGIAETHFRKNKWERQRLGLVVLNGNGQIRALTDYKATDAVDPNDIDEIHEKNREFHLRRNNHDERKTFGNLNLLKLQNGAGSTIKPIMYAAVASQYNLGWKNLRTMAIRESLIPHIQDENGKLAYYGGKKVGVSWKGISDADYLPKSGRDYLVQSKNLYHSLVMFLGSYDPEDFRRRQGQLPRMMEPLRRVPDSLDFPLFTLGNGPLTIREDAWPQTSNVESTFFGSKRSLLADGLSYNFGMPIDYAIDAQKKDYRDIDPAGAAVFADAGAGPRLYAYPEEAHFYQRDRAFDPKNPLWFINGLRQVTAGSDPVIVTPLKMAEMSGRLFSQNRNFSVTLSDSVSALPYAPWVSDAKSWGKGGFQQFMQENLYGSLHAVLSVGTAYRLWRKIRQRRSGFHYYAKTGTISDSSLRETLPDKLLMLVISKGDLTELTAEELAENKFYVLYFSGMELFMEQEPDKFWNLFADMVETVEDSYLFQSYMQ